MAPPTKDDKTTAAPAAHGHGNHRMQHIAGGGLAGLCEVLIMYPLDVVKTRFQLAVGAERMSIMGTFREMIAKEGFWSLYRGIISPILAEAPKRALKFTSNEEYKKLLTQFVTGGKPLTDPLFVVAGAGAGVTEAFINCPFELVKVRMQAKENKGVYKTTWDAARTIVAREGPLALFKGLETMIWRNGMWNAVYFGLINKTKRTLFPPVTKETPRWRNMTQNFIAGLIAGTAATVSNNPFDVVKSRIQNVLPGQAPKYNWVIPGLFKVLREEGVAALYKGFTPKVLRLGPGGGIMLVAFDFFTNLFNKYGILQ